MPYFGDLLTPATRSAAWSPWCGSFATQPRPPGTPLDLGPAPRRTRPRAARGAASSTSDSPADLPRRARPRRRPIGRRRCATRTGRRSRPADLTRPWTFHGGSEPADVTMRVAAGVGGTPMPGYTRRRRAPRELWDARLLRALARPRAVARGEPRRPRGAAARRRGPVPRGARRVRRQVRHVLPLPRADEPRRLVRRTAASAPAACASPSTARRTRLHPQPDARIRTPGSARWTRGRPRAARCATAAPRRARAQRARHAVDDPHAARRSRRRRDPRLSPDAARRFATWSRRPRRRCRLRGHGREGRDVDRGPAGRRRLSSRQRRSVAGEERGRAGGAQSATTTWSVRVRRSSRLLLVLVLSPSPRWLVGACVGVAHRGGAAVYTWPPLRWMPSALVKAEPPFVALRTVSRRCRPSAAPPRPSPPPTPTPPPRRRAAATSPTIGHVLALPHRRPEPHAAVAPFPEMGGGCASTGASSGRPTRAT